MNITIKYCGMWGYKPRAQLVGDEILDRYPNAEVFLEVGNSGQFDVINEDEFGITTIIFSKDKVNRFPDEGEIINLLGEE